MFFPFCILHFPFCIYFHPLFLLGIEAQKNGQSSSRCGSVTLAFCRRTVAAFITLTPLRYACPYSVW